MNKEERDCLAAYCKNRPPRYYKGQKIELVHALTGDGKVHIVMIETGRYRGYAVFGHEPYKFHIFETYSEASDYICRRNIAAADPDVEVLPPGKAVRMRVTLHGESSEVRFFNSYLEAAAYCAKMEPVLAALHPKKRFCHFVVFGWCQLQFEFFWNYEEALQFCLGMTEEAVCGVREGGNNQPRVDNLG